MRAGRFQPAGATPVPRGACQDWRVWRMWRRLRRSRSPTISGYPEHRCVATEFWCGEEADADNDFISNAPSAWCDDWVASFGGIDHPRRRNGYLPAGFVPRENPFYLALPFADYDEKGVRPNVRRIPWHFGGPDQYPENESLLKNRWVQVRHRGRTAYGQW